MQLITVEKSQRKKVMNSILSGSVSPEEKDEIMENLQVFFDEEGADLMATMDGNEYTGFFIASPYSEGGVIEELVLEEFYFPESKVTEDTKAELASQIKNLKKTYKPNLLEVIITQEISWLGVSLAEQGFLCELIKLEKMLPQKKNLPDVLELVHDSIPEDRIADEMMVQVLMQNGDNYDTEILVSDEDLKKIMDSDWIPILIVLSFEPNDQKVEEIIETSNQLIYWDDFELTYSS